MKMIARMFCAAALVLGAFSLVGCDAKKDEAAKPADTNKVQKAVDKAADAGAKAADAGAKAADKAAEKVAK
jgi:uncharacterized lipoprotein NlpE involved in copper resistance